MIKALTVIILMLSGSVCFGNDAERATLIPRQAISGHWVNYGKAESEGRNSHYYFGPDQFYLVLEEITIVDGEDRPVRQIRPHTWKEISSAGRMINIKAAGEGERESRKKHAYAGIYRITFNETKTQLTLKSVQDGWTNEFVYIDDQTKPDLKVNSPVALHDRSNLGSRKAMRGHWIDSSGQIHYYISRLEMVVVIDEIGIKQELVDEGEKMRRNQQKLRRPEKKISTFGRLEFSISYIIMSSKDYSLKLKGRRKLADCDQLKSLDSDIDLPSSIRRGLLEYYLITFNESKNTMTLKNEGAESGIVLYYTDNQSRPSKLKK
jgi:hypothetical protein